MICRQANDGRFFLLLMQGEMGLGFGRKTGRSDRAVLDARLCIGVRVGSANRRDIYGLSRYRVQRASCGGEAERLDVAACRGYRADGCRLVWGVR